MADFPGHFRDVRASLERAATRRRSGESLDRSNRCLLGDGDYQLERSALVDFFACDSLHSWPLSPAALALDTLILSYLQSEKNYKSRL
jgi:hypothetical protein